MAGWGNNNGPHRSVSGSHVAINGVGSPAEFIVTAPGGTKFNFNSVYLTGAWNDDLIVTIVAYRDGTAVSTTTHTLSATAPTLVTLNLSQIDRVRFSSAGGTPHAAYGTNPGYQFAMDNLDISFNLPPTGVTATAGNAQATVAFTPPPPDAANPVTGYQATCTPQGGGTAVSANGAGSPIVVPGLTNGTLYDCTVTTLYAAGGSVPSAPAAVTPMATVPAAPTGVTATAAPTQASLAFTAPADTGGSPITGYQASCTPQGGGTAVTATGAASPIVVAGLTNGTLYDCTVTTLYAAGGSVPSAPAAVTPMATVPAAPTGVTATAAPTQASLAFTAPADTGGSPITGYQASCTPQGGGTAVTATGAASPIVVAGLTNGTTYDCTVAAVNAVGTGAASAPVAVTPQAAPVAAVTAVPTLSQWGLMLLGLAAAGLGARRLRRS